MRNLRVKWSRQLVSRNSLSVLVVFFLVFLHFARREQWCEEVLHQNTVVPAHFLSHPDVRIPPGCRHSSVMSVLKSFGEVSAGNTCSDWRNDPRRLGKCGHMTYMMSRWHTGMLTPAIWDTARSVTAREETNHANLPSSVAAAEEVGESTVRPHKETKSMLSRSTC